MWVEGQRSELTGIIADSATGEPVEYAQILNFSLQKQTYSNRNGQFTLEAKPGDTLVIYGLGYYYLKLTVGESMLDKTPVSVLLIPQPYNLSAANIPGFGSYENFRRKLVSVSPPMTQTEQLNKSMEGLVLQAAMDGFNEYMQKNVSIVSISIRTPEEIERIKLSKIEKKQQIRDRVYHKFNPVVVKEITGLTDDDGIIEFMVWCKFTDAYILEANEYDLAERIAAKFELFRKKKEEEKINSDPLNRIDQFLWQFA